MSEEPATALVELKRDAVLETVREKAEQGEDPLKMPEECRRGMTVVGDRFQSGEFDIFAAKEVLAGHLCIGGDVHPTLLSLGRPEEVEAYCRRLIDEIGRDGGLILNVGCSIPYEIKPENFRAFLETGKNYTP